jgi:ABC-2 type transport system permease protein
MMNSIELYFKLISMSVKGQMQYRASFVMYIVGCFIMSFVEFIAIAVLFARFGSLKGWSLYEMGMFYGMVSMGFALAEALARGFDIFAQQVITGEFDRTLLRPRATGFQVLAHDFQLHRFGRFFQGLAVFAWAAAYLTIGWDAGKAALLVFALAGLASVFTGLFIMQAAMCFWSTQSLEVMNSFTYGGVEAMQWPLTVFKKWFAWVFVAIIPLACTLYFPLAGVLGRDNGMGLPDWFQYVSPLAGAGFLGVSLVVWRVGVKHYRSTGS